MHGDRNSCRAHIVAVVSFRQLMTETFRINIRASLTTVSNKRWIDRNANDVVARRNRILTVTTVQNKVLTGKCKPISIGPACCNTLIAGDTDRATASESCWTRRNTTNRNRVWIGIEHAEATLRRAPNLARSGIDEFVQRVVAEVVMVMTS